jgi:flagellar basal-body rod protein FlgF
MYISAAGADVQSQRLEILSNNLANVDTPGFKREIAILQAENAEAIEQGEAVAGSGGPDDVGGGVTLAGTMTDFSPGKMRTTGRPTDLTIVGEGFFLVGQENEQFLTRAGNFHFSSIGQLQTDQGHDVLTGDGQPITVNPNLPYQFNEDGSITQQGARIDLGIVRPQSLGDLVKQGENLFSALAEVQPVANQDKRVISGQLEMSAVSPTHEMMELIETSRAYEANVKMIQNQDQMLGSLINRVMRQP